MVRFISAFLLSILTILSQAEEIKLYAESAPPNAYLDNGKLSGRAIEVSQAVLNQIGSADLPINLVPWARGYALLKAEKNTALFPVSRTPERENMFKWAGEIMPNTIYLYRLKSRSDIVINSLEDIDKYKLGLTRNDVKDTLLSQYSDNKEYVPEDKLNFLKAANGRIDIFPYASPRFSYEVKKANLDPNLFEKIYLLSSISTPQYLAFNMQTDDEIVEKFKAGFSQLSKEGKLQTILDKWE